MVFADDKFGLSELPFSYNYQSDALLWSDEEKKWSAVKKRQGDRAATGSEGEWHTASLNGMKNNHLRIVNPKHFGT